LCYQSGLAAAKRTEHFLAAHQHALGFCGRVSLFPAKNLSIDILRPHCSSRILLGDGRLLFINPRNRGLVGSQYGGHVFTSHFFCRRMPNEKRPCGSGGRLLKKKFIVPQRPSTTTDPLLNHLNPAARHFVCIRLPCPIFHTWKHTTPIEPLRTCKDAFERVTSRYPPSRPLPRRPTGAIRSVPTAAQCRLFRGGVGYQPPNSVRPSLLIASQPMLTQTNLCRSLCSTTAKAIGHPTPGLRSRQS